jgi:AcrR family transcriptional regulator
MASSASGTSTDGRDGPARRSPGHQARGQRRIRALLAAGERVFAEVGYERASTNLIARRAGASPGTLYQFFPHKAAIAEALATRYAARLAAAHAQAFRQDGHVRPFPRVIGDIVDAFVAFHRQAPAFQALFLASSASPRRARVCETLEGAAVDQVTSLLVERTRRTPSDARRVAEVCVLVFQGFIPALRETDGREHVRLVHELKLVLQRYLAPMAPAAASRRGR